MGESGLENVVVRDPDARDVEPVAAEEPRIGGVATLTDAVSALGEQFQAHQARAEARERVIDQLHGEVERLRAGEQAVVLRPVVTDLQNLRGELLRQVRTLPADMDRDRMIRLLESFALDVELALERCGSVPVTPQVGDRFSGREHRAVKTIAATCADENGTIGEVLADGYQDITTGRVVAAAKVHVRRWTPPATTTEGGRHAVSAEQNGAGEANEGSTTDG